MSVAGNVWERGEGREGGVGWEEGGGWDGLGQRGGEAFAHGSQGHGGMGGVGGISSERGEEEERRGEGEKDKGEGEEERGEGEEVRGEVDEESMRRGEIDVKWMQVWFHFFKKIVKILTARSTTGYHVHADWWHLYILNP
jgi:hypothetical protein